MALLKGRAYWAKVTGEPRVNDFTPDQRQWSVDVSLDAEAKTQLTNDGLLSKIKNKGDERGDFITFKRNEFKKDNTTRNQPIKVVDHHGNVWRDRVLIGNGSTVNVRYNTYDGFRGQKGVAILALQVWDLIPYVVNTVGDEDNFPTKPEEDQGEVV